MRDSNPMKAERAVQQKFRIRDLAGGLLLIAAIAIFYNWLFYVPNRTELGWRPARLEFQPVALDPAGFGPLRLAGAWQVTSDDQRFGGVSGLAIDRGQLLALTDSGVVIRFNRPDLGGGQIARSAVARIGELATGPGDGRFKRNRDAEVLLRDPGGRGWWVAFENRHALWLFDRQFRRVLQSISLNRYGWRRNRGVEAVAAQGQDLLVFADNGSDLFRVTGSQIRRVPVGHAGGPISDSVALASGEIVAIERRLTVRGFRNALVMLEPAGAGYRFGRRVALPLGPLDNLEAIAVEQLANGQRRLWLMTDDNLQPPLRTLLIALDWPASPPLKQARRESPGAVAASKLPAER